MFRKNIVNITKFAWKVGLGGLPSIYLSISISIYIYIYIYIIYIYIYNLYIYIIYWEKWLRMNSIKDIDIWLQMNYWAFIRGLWCCDGLRGGIFGRSLWSRQKHRTFHWNPKGSTGRRAWVHLCKWWWNLSVQWKGSWAKGQIDALSFLRRSSKHTHTYIYIYTYRHHCNVYVYYIYTYIWDVSWNFEFSGGNPDGK